MQIIHGGQLPWRYSNHWTKHVERTRYYFSEYRSTENKKNNLIEQCKELPNRNETRKMKRDQRPARREEEKTIAKMRGTCRSNAHSEGNKRKEGLQQDAPVMSMITQRWENAFVGSQMVIVVRLYVRRTRKAGEESRKNKNKRSSVLSGYEWSNRR
jgi:hypothetical protein